MSVTAINRPADHDQSDLSDHAEQADQKSTASITKALHVLEAFREAGPALGVSDIARIAGMPKSTAFRLLSHLAESGYVERAGRLYMLGSRIFELGNAVQMCRPDGLRGLALPHLGELYATTGKVAHLAVLEGTDVVYLEKVYGLKALSVDTVVGGRTPAACSALGKAMLAFSDRSAIGRVLDAGLTRRTAYSHTDPSRFLGELRWVSMERVAYDREENRLGLACAAAPILMGGRAVGAISISGASTRFDTGRLGEQIGRAAEAITQALRRQAS